MDRANLKTIKIDGDIPTDKNGTTYKDGDIFDIHQTVNGCNLFRIIYDNDDVVVYYYCNMVNPRKYEYSIRELLELEDSIIPWKDNEIIGNIYERSDSNGQ